jgi:hypothetical protein
MIDSRPGIYRCILGDPGTFATTPTNLVCIGSESGGTFSIEPYLQPTATKGKKLRNMMLFKYEVDSSQLRLRDLDILIQFIQSTTGFDCQIVRERQNTSIASGGIFNFLPADNQGMSIQFKWNQTDKERNCHITLQMAMTYEAANAFIDASDGGSTLTPAISAIVQSGDNERGQNAANIAHPWFGSIESPSGTPLFNDGEIETYDLTIETKGRIKEATGLFTVTFFTCTIHVVGSNNSITQMIQIMSTTMMPTLVMQQELSEDSPIFEKYIFAAGTVSIDDKYTHTDEKSNADITLAGDIAVFGQAEFAYGSANGGTTTGEGDILVPADYYNGGTMTVTL